MLYHIFGQLSGSVTFSNLTRYITFRAFIAFLLALIVSMVWGKFFIELMKRKQFGQVVRDDGPQTHLKKKGTPTMGGVFMLGAILVSLLFTGNFASKPFWAVSVVTFSYFLLGFIDDYLKVLKKNTKGVPGKVKLLWQGLTAFSVGYYLLSTGVITSDLYIPFMKTPLLNLGMFPYLIFMTLVIVGSSNAVNLTDGLDGLAIGPIMMSAGTLAFFAYLSGHFQLSEYLIIPHISGAGELSVILAATVGAGAGFLWYNSFPAQIFMGDSGSLALGGLLGTTAVCTKNEILFFFLGGIFVAEALSVMIQVFSYKTRKKRVFKMAPIHHHFELSGWSETKVIVRFWIIALILAVLALATLKIR
jgi:phospho-N-acetylmuramoyl-pentapeptide-transferase